MDLHLQNELVQETQESIEKSRKEAIEKKKQKVVENLSHKGAILANLYSNFLRISEYKRQK